MRETEDTGKLEMNIIVFDTETIGKVSQDLLNIGYHIVDVNIQQGTAEVLQKRDYLVTSLINNRVYCLNDDFVGAEKYGMYLTLLEDKQIIKRSIPQIFKTLANDLKRYNVLFGYAYNNQFDLDKFSKTAAQYGIDNPMETIPQFDIWGYACKYICDTPEYKTWATENGILTATQTYISTSVESVSKYLYNDLEFKEDHTALSDTKHELNILLECIKKGCDITRDTKRFFINSDKILNETLVINGETIEVEYKKKYTRNGKTTYKM